MSFSFFIFIIFIICYFIGEAQKLFNFKIKERSIITRCWSLRVEMSYDIEQDTSMHHGVPAGDLRSYFDRVRKCPQHRHNWQTIDRTSTFRNLQVEWERWNREKSSILGSRTKRMWNGNHTYSKWKEEETIVLMKNYW